MQAPSETLFPAQIVLLLLMGEAMQRLGQPAVMGQLVAGLRPKSETLSIETERVALVPPPNPGDHQLRAPSFLAQQLASLCVDEMQSGAGGADYRREGLVGLLGPLLFVDQPLDL